MGGHVSKETINHVANKQDAALQLLQAQRGQVLDQLRNHHNERTQVLRLLLQHTPVPDFRNMDNQAAELYAKDLLTFAEIIVREDNTRCTGELVAEMQKLGMEIPKPLHDIARIYGIPVATLASPA